MGGLIVEAVIAMENKKPEEETIVHRIIYLQPPS